MSKHECKIVVCGATGMVGSHLVAELLAAGYRRITLVVRSASSLLLLEQTIGSLHQSGIELCESRLDDVASLTTIFEGAHTVFNCAAIVKFTAKESQSIIRTNTLIAATIVEAARRVGVKHIIHTGSIASLQTSGDITREDNYFSSLQGHSPYAVSKFYSDCEIEKASLHGIRTTIVQPSVILGSGSWKTDHISGLFSLVAKGLPFYSNGTTGYVDVLDVALAMRLLSETSGDASERYILNAANLSFGQLFTKISRSLGVSAPWLYVPKWLLKLITWSLLKLERKGVFLALNSATVKCLYSQSAYDGSKVEKIGNFSYRSIDDTISRIASEYKSK